MDKIDKVGGIILDDKKLLVVKKYTKENKELYIIPGGRRAGNETDFETLRRELKEELRIDLTHAENFGGFDDIAIFENIPIHIEVYIATYGGVPTCDSEIKELVWIDRDYKTKEIELGSILSKFVIPELINRDMMWKPCLFIVIRSWSW